MTPAGKTAIDYRDGNENDIDEISNFRKVFIAHSQGKRRSIESEYYHWKFLENPTQKGLFYFAEASDKIVGMATITPKRLLVFGQYVNGAEIGDTFVHPDYQRRGIFSNLVNLCRGQALDLGIDPIYGTPNENSLPGYEKKLDFPQIPSAQVYSLVRPLNMKPVLESRFDSHVLSSLLAPFLHIYYKLRYRLQPGNFQHSKIQIEEITTFPEDMEMLLKRAHQKYDWIMERNKKYLDWRFGSNPDTYRILIARDSRGVVGYLVAKIGTWKNLHVGYLADFLTIENDTRVFEQMLSQAIKWFIDANIDMLAGWSVANSHYDRILRSKGFQVDKPVPVITYRKSKIGAEILERDARWHFTMADSDNI